MKVQVLSSLPDKIMTVKELESKKLYKEYLIEIPYEEVDNSINEKINEIIPTVTLPGFRKGKAPLNIVKKKYENNILNEVLDKIVQEKTKNLLDDKKIKILRQPRVELKKYVKNEPLELGVKIDLEPDIKLFPFEKINVTKYDIALDKKTTDKNYENFINSQTKYSKITSNRSVIDTDKILININTNDAKVPDFLKNQQNVPVITDSDYQILPDISKRLIDKKAKVGDLLKISFDLKDVLKTKNKNEVEFEINIVSIEEKIKFVVDKEFLNMHNLKNEKDLVTQINDNLSKQYENYLKEIEKKQLMDILESKHNFDIPEGMLKEEFDLIWHKVEHAKKDNKLDEDDKKLSDEKLKKRYEKIASRRVKLAILMQYIANSNKVEVSEKEISDAMINYASQYPGQEKQIFDYFKKNPSSIESIKGPILEQKIVDLILLKTNQTKKKINVEEYKKLQEETFNLKRDK